MRCELDFSDCHVVRCVTSRCCRTALHLHTCKWAPSIAICAAEKPIAFTYSSPSKWQQQERCFLIKTRRRVTFRMSVRQRVSLMCVGRVIWHSGTPVFDTTSTHWPSSSSPLRSNLLRNIRHEIMALMRHATLVSTIHASIVHCSLRIGGVDCSTLDRHTTPTSE